MNPHVIAWAIKHQVSADALQELGYIFGLNRVDYEPPHTPLYGEAKVQSAVRLEASRKGLHLFRNNVGALVDERGVPVRYGLANDSKKLNAVIKSGDLIGWRSILIGQEHVGMLIAQFVSRECKPEGWHFTGTEHERAQLAWAELVVASGGDASFCSGEGTL